MNESQNDAITMSVQIYEQSLALYEKIWGLYNWLRISGALTIDPVTGVVTGSNITAESVCDKEANTALGCGIGEPSFLGDRFCRDLLGTTSIRVIK